MLCPFCKEEIQEGAIKCKHCGSMLNEKRGNISVNANSEGATSSYATYAQVPWFRKNWFAILCAFIPLGMLALFFILVTGDIYYEKKGQLTKYTKGAKVFLIIWGILVILYLLFSMLN